MLTAAHGSQQPCSQKLISLPTQYREQWGRAGNQGLAQYHIELGITTIVYEQWPLQQLASAPRICQGCFCTEY